MIKNTAGQKWVVFAFDTTTGLPKTGDALNITANLRLDGGAANPVDDTNPTELEGGYYAFDLTDAETNGNMIVICPSSVTANIAVIGVPGALYTESDFTATMKASLNAATPAASNMRGTDNAALAVDLATVAGYLDTEIGTIITAVGTTIPNAIAALPTDADVNAACDTAISDAALATAANLATVDTVVDAIKLKTDTINGAGALIWTYTLTDSVTAAAIPDATVIITSDSAGTNVLRSGVTNSVGIVTFYFAPGDSGTTVYVWRTHAGYNFTNPDSEVLS
jgi:hypothetical protein